MRYNIYIYILVMAGVSYLIRMLPMTLIRRKITNEFIKSFLYYVPYVILSVMTFPAIIEVTKSPVSGTVALAAGIVLALFGANLIAVSAACCALVFVAEMIMF